MKRRSFLAPALSPVIAGFFSAESGKPSRKEKAMKMRKATLWAVPLLFAAMITPCAHADSLFTYTFTNNDTNDPNFSLTFTTDPIAAATTQTIIAAADLASYSATGSYWEGLGISQVTLNYEGIGDEVIVGGNSGLQVLYPDSFPIADYSAPGTYAEHNYTLVVTEVDTPEPSTLLLFGSGLAGLAFLFRRRLFA